MKKVLLLLTLLLMSCGESTKKENYQVTYEVLYPSGARQFTVNTKSGKARVTSYHSGFFENGQMVYTLKDDNFVQHAYEEYPIVIISQKKY